MKVILYMTITVNGFIADEKDEVDFVSKNSWKGYKDIVKKSDFIVVGRRTYDVMPEEEFEESAVYCVFTHDKLDKKLENVRFVGEPPKHFLADLKKEGAKQVLIGGGGRLNALFLKENLVDEIYLDVMPAVLGKGIPLFSGEDFQTKLKLLETKKLSANELQLHYKIVK